MSARARAPSSDVPAASVPTILVTGPVGSGKTTVATEMGRLLSEAGIAHAVVDFDQLTEYRPRAADDPFGAQVGLANLTAVWNNYAGAGAKRLIIARVIESRDDLAGLRQALPEANITVVRLRASVTTIQTRVRGREIGGALEWHLARASELAELMDARKVEDVLVEAEERDPASIAHDILARVGWLRS